MAAADYDLFSYLTPEQAQALAGASVMPDRQAALQRQMEQAQALRKGSGQHYDTGLGAGLGGLGDALSSAVGSIQGKQLRGQESQLIDQQQQGLGGYYDAIRQMALAQALRNQPTPDMEPNPYPKPMSAPPLVQAD